MLSYAKHGKFPASIQAARQNKPAEKAPFGPTRHAHHCSALEVDHGMAGSAMQSRHRYRNRLESILRKGEKESTRHR